MSVSTSEPTVDSGPAGGAIPGPPGLHYLPALDGLRGFAILGVILCHYGTEYIPAAGMVGKIWDRIGSAGGTGVDLFFVLSGFLITRILLRERHRAHYFRTFYARRTLRIFPLYYGVLISAFGRFLFRTPHPAVVLGGGRWTLWVYLTNIWAAFHGRWVGPVGAVYVDHFWSLAVEEQFYLVWPAIVLMLSNRNLLWMCVAAIVSAFILRITGTFIFHQYYFAYAFIGCRWDGLAVGSALAVLGQTDRYFPTLTTWARPIATVMALGLAAAYSIDRGEAATQIAMLITESLSPFLYGAVICLAVFSPSGLIATVTSKPYAILVGRYSYGMYVFHYLLLFPIVLRLYSMLGVPFGQPLALWKVMVFSLAGFMATLLVAIISYHCYELPFLKLKRFFSY